MMYMHDTSNCCYNNNTVCTLYSGAVKSYDHSLCDKSTKFGVVIRYFILGWVPLKITMVNPPLLTFSKNFEPRKPYKSTLLSSTCILYINEHENMFVCSKNMFIVNCLYFSV